MRVVHLEAFQGLIRWGNVMSEALASSGSEEHANQRTLASLS